MFITFVYSSCDEFKLVSLHLPKKTAKECQPLQYNANNALTACHKLMPKMADVYLKGCTFDVTHGGSDKKQRNEIACGSFEAYVAECDTAFPNADVSSWRTDLGCRKFNSMKF